MKFRLRTEVVLSKEFEIEAEHLKDATRMVERLIMEEKDLSGFELTHIGFDMNDPSIREYNARMCKEILAEE